MKQVESEDLARRFGSLCFDLCVGCGDYGHLRLIVGYHDEYDRRSMRGSIFENYNIHLDHSFQLDILLLLIL